MPRYGRDFGRSRWEEERLSRPWGRSDFGSDPEGYGSRFGGARPEGRGRMYGGFSEDALDEPGGYGAGGGYGEEFDSGYRGGSGMGGYSGGPWGRGYESRDERDFGGYERGFEGSWGSRGGQGGYGGRPAGRDSLGERGYETFGEQHSGSYGRGGLSGRPRGGDEIRRLRAADIMTENPECVTPDVSLADAARKMRDLDVGIIPVVESDGNRRLRGVITDRDIAIRAVADGRDAHTTRVSEVMTTDVETCNKNDPVQNVMRLMEREQVRRVPITDREGRLVGIIAQADLATELDDDRSEVRVANTIERISEPARGESRSSSGMRAGSRGDGASRGRAAPQGSPPNPSESGGGVTGSDNA